MLTENNEVDDFFQELFHFGRAMYLVGCHYLSIKHLLCNPKAFADKAMDAFCPSLSKFKENPTVKGMKALLTETCSSQASNEASSSGVCSAKRNLAALLEETDSDEGDLPTNQLPRQVPQMLPEPKSIRSNEKKKNKKAKKH